MRKLIALTAVLAIILSTFTYSPASASEKSTYIKKIVSLVYDDSGSMLGDKWAYANYAVQTFCGMLNSEDQLYITYMSRAQLQPDYKPEKIDLSSGGIQKSVDTLRKHTENKDTPFKSVNLAFDKLCNTDCEDENAQYWLVVITDGVFDEISQVSNEERKRYLNEKFSSFAGISMPNGSRVQTNFISIGGAIAPDNNDKLGIYTYNADTSDGIISAMSDMAHKVSGRTRIEKNDIKKTAGNKIEITSSLPLLNIAVVSQKSDAVIKSVKNNKGKKLRINRDVSASYGDYSDLHGKIYLVGDTKKITDEGTYEITFDRDVDPDKLVIMIEPALETRIFVEHDGKTYDSISDIKKITNGEKVKVCFKVYKIGDNKEIPASQLGTETEFSLSLYENGEKVLSNDDGSMELKEYTLSDEEVRIKAAVQVKGFNPIGSSVAFIPARYGSGDEFSIKGEFIGEKQNVKYRDISSNKDMGICFTIYENGEPVTDPDKVRAALPEITVTPDGNEGEVTVAEDGKIVYIPKKATLPSADAEKFNVEVSCTIGGNKTATKEYTVLVSDYEMVVLKDNIEIVKTGFFNNQKAVSFCIKKNGEQLDRESIEDSFEVNLGEKFKDIKTRIDVSDDGVITVRPYSENEYKLTFFNWWVNWFKYFSLGEGDMPVRLSHELCSAEANIKVKGESFLYQLLNVYLPLLIELVLLALFVIWLVLIITKPKFTDTAKLYVGTVRYNKLKQNHILTGFESESLKKYNKIKKGNGRLKFKRDADIVDVMGVKIRAGFGDRIFCESPQPWYKVSVEPTFEDPEMIKTPELMEKYFSKNRRLEIEEISALEAIDNESAKNMGPNNSRAVKYIVIPDGYGTNDKGLTKVDGRFVIRSGKMFIYKD